MQNRRSLKVFFPLFLDVFLQIESLPGPNLVVGRSRYSWFEAILWSILWPGSSSVALISSDLWLGLALAFVMGERCSSLL